MTVMEGATLLADGNATASALAFEPFFRGHYPTLVRALYLMVGSHADAEDLAQEAMARVCERWDRVSRMDSPAGYLYRTAMNLNRNRLRSLAVRAAHRVVELFRSPDPSEIVEQRSRVMEALALLPPDQRDVIVLVEALGLEVEEVARICHIKPVSVRVRLHRAKQTIRGGGMDRDE